MGRMTTVEEKYGRPVAAISLVSKDAFDGTEIVAHCPLLSFML